MLSYRKSEMNVTAGTGVWPKIESHSTSPSAELQNIK